MKEVNWRASVATAVFPLAPWNKSEKKHEQNVAYWVCALVTTKASWNHWTKRGLWTTIVELRKYVTGGISSWSQTNTRVSSNPITGTL